jgi:branched-chain amino acid transport system substrate-binding protein
MEQYMKNSLKTLVAALALCATSAAIAAEPIKIGVSGPFTGGSAPMGVSMRDGVKLAADEINHHGGILGRQIKLIERDDQADNSRGIQVTQELINREHVIATLGFINTGVSLAAQRFYEEAKIPVINNVATGSIVTKQFLPPQYPDNYVFRTSANDGIQSAMIVEDAIVKRKFTRVAILADSTNYGQLGREDLEKALAAKGIKPVAEEKFNIKDVDMTAQLLKAKAAGAQAILTYGIGPELAQIANGMEKLNWKVPMIGSWTLSMVISLTTPARMVKVHVCHRPSFRNPIHRNARPLLLPTNRLIKSSAFLPQSRRPRVTIPCTFLPLPSNRRAALMAQKSVRHWRICVRQWLA